MIVDCRLSTFDIRYSLFDIRCRFLLLVEDDLLLGLLIGKGRYLGLCKMATLSSLL